MLPGSTLLVCRTAGAKAGEQRGHYTDKLAVLPQSASRSPYRYFNTALACIASCSDHTSLPGAVIAYFQCLTTTTPSTVACSLSAPDGSNVRSEVVPVV